MVSPALASARGEPPTPADATYDLLSTVHRIPEVAVAPDGRRVAWIEEARHEGAGSESLLQVAPVGGGAQRRIRVGKGRSTVHHIAWASDGRLALLSDAETPGQRQLFVVDAG